MQLLANVITLWFGMNVITTLVHNKWTKQKKLHTKILHKSKKKTKKI